MKRKLLPVCVILILLNLGFIWGNSMLPAVASAGTSGRLHTWLMAHFPEFAWIGEKLLRKLAHFCEFAALGFLFRWLFVLMECSGFTAFAGTVLAGMLAANVDETIQLYNPGRGPSLTDVWLDTFGVCVGMGVLCLLHFLIWKLFERKR